MKPIRITFGGGIQSPAKIGTNIIKLASEGKMGYAQNIDCQNDEYGNGVIVPGPALPTIGSNAELTGVPFCRQFWGDIVAAQGYIYFAEGILGASDYIRRIKDVEADETPVIDTAANTSLAVTHSAHTAIVIEDLAYRKNAADTNTILILGKDATDMFLQKITASSATFATTLTNIYSNVNSTGGYNYHRLCVAAYDNKAYISYNNLIRSVADDDSTVDVTAFTLPTRFTITELIEWNKKLVMAVVDPRTTVSFPSHFALRKAAVRASLVMWNFSDTNYDKDYPCPSRYISAMIVAPDGNLIVFGGIDEGKTTLYYFTGYGFKKIISYIGEMPLNRHAVDFDGQGRIIWQTADGQILRYAFEGIIEHLGTINTTAGNGGMLMRLLGGSGNEFVCASGKTGAPNTFTMKRVTFGSYLGDGASASDISTTPLAVSGMISLPRKGAITEIQVNLAKALASGEKIAVQIYKNGSTTATAVDTLDFSVDGAIASKRIAQTIPDLSNFAIGLAWKMTDAAAAAPPVIDVLITYQLT